MVEAIVSVSPKINYGNQQLKEAVQSRDCQKPEGTWDFSIHSKNSKLRIVELQSTKMTVLTFQFIYFNQTEIRTESHSIFFSFILICRSNVQ